MRFGIKTAPQHTTWSDMLDVWRAADDIDAVRVGVELRPLLPDLLRLRRAVPRSLDDARGNGAGDASHPDRLPGYRHDLPPSGRPREHGRNRRHHLAAGGSTSASARAGTSRNATRTASAPAAQGTLRPLRRRGRGARAVVVAGDEQLRRRSTCSCATRAANRSPCSSRIRRSRSAGTGRHERCARSRVSRNSGTRPPASNTGRRASDTLEKRCAEIGRDPSTIDYSVNLRYDASAGPSALADSAAAFAAAGAEHGHRVSPGTAHAGRSRTHRAGPPTLRRLRSAR